MELFPAGDESAWQLIQGVIDTSDYYVLIMGGRYGSLDEGGLSYTEKEYDFALSRKKPVIPLLHQNPDNLPRDRTDTEQAAWTKLKSFRAKAERRHTCVYWSTADDLKAKVIVGVMAAIRRSPGIGWMRGDTLASDVATREILRLRNRVDELERQVESARTQPPEGAANLAQGTDSFGIEYSYEYSDDEDEEYRASGKFEATWHEVFGHLGPRLIDRASDTEIRGALSSWIQDVEEGSLLTGDVSSVSNFSVAEVSYQTIKIQLRALGLITRSTAKTSPRDTRTYWTLTPFGDQLLTQLRAIPRAVTNSEPAPKRSTRKTR
jgi:hypothetical protein